MNKLHQFFSSRNNNNISPTSTTMYFFVIALPILSMAASQAVDALRSDLPNSGLFMRVRPGAINTGIGNPRSNYPPPSSPRHHSSGGPSFSEWSVWSNCSSKCTQRRKRTCLTPGACGRNVIIERRECPEKRTPEGLVIPCVQQQPQQTKRDARHQTFLKRLLSDIYDPTREEESTLTMEEFLYSDWSSWSHCSRSCRQKRFKECQFPLLCGRKMILEERGCFPEGTRCSEMKRNIGSYNRTKIVYGGDDDNIEEPPMEQDDFRGPDEDESGENDFDGAAAAPSTTSATEATKDGQRNEGRREKKRDRKGRNETAIAFGEFECGLRPTFNPRRLRIIGGTLSRRGAWPWQVSVMNR